MRTDRADDDGGLLIRNAEINGTRVHVHVRDGAVVSIGPAEASLAYRGRPDVVVDAGGGALLPGLVDHHLHLHALAAADRSVRCGPPTVTDRAGLAAALDAAPADDRGWVRGTGYAAGDLDAATLDALHPHRPVRVQHRSGALWVVNSAGAALLGLDTATHPGVERDAAGRPTGRLWRADDWLRTRLPSTGPPDLTAVAARLAAAGITHVTDATPDLDAAALASLATVPQHVHALGVPLGTTPPHPVTAGPYKIVLADSGLPDLDDLVDRIRTAHAHGRGVAAHCVTREALLLFLVALDAAGSAGDRVEHGALIPAETVADLALRGLAVVTQPGFLADRGDAYLRDVPAVDLPDLYRCRSLRDAGVPLALSSDAPYGPLDPWTVIAAAVTREIPGDGARVLGPAERLPARHALSAYLAAPDDPGGPPRFVEIGMAADLVVLDRPLAAALRDPGAVTVRATLIDGGLVHAAP